MSVLRPIYLLAALLILFLLLAACRREPAPLAVDEQVQAVCTDECGARGQCGRLTDERLVVLANEGGPAVSLHNRFFLDQALVTIREVSPRELIAARDGVPLISEATRFPHLFYRVEGEGKIAWVSEWCLVRP
jgi:hypothetical protein